MKILFIVPGLDLGGTEKFVLSLSGYLSTDHKIKVVSLSNKKFLYKSFLESKIDVQIINFKNFFLLPVSFLKLFILIRKFQPDFVQTFLYSADLIGGLTSYFAGIKKIFWSVRHDSLVATSYGGFYLPVLLKILVKLSKKVPKKIFYNSQSSLMWHQAIGFPAHKQIFIPNPVPAWTMQIQFDNKFKFLEGTPFRMGMAASFTNYKGHKAVLETLCSIQQSVPIVLSFCGRDTEMHGPLYKFIKNQYADIFSICEFYGALDDKRLIDWYSNLNLFLSPSEVEGFPNSLAEACAFGLPSLATNVGMSKSLILDDYCLLDSIQSSLNTTLSTMIINYEQHFNFASKRRGILLTKYSQDKIFTEFLAEWKI